MGLRDGNMAWVGAPREKKQVWEADVKFFETYSHFSKTPNGNFSQISMVFSSYPAIVLIYFVFQMLFVSEMCRYIQPHTLPHP
jgi:hypothetical protein